MPVALNNDGMDLSDSFMFVLLTISTLICSGGSKLYPS